MNNNFVCVSLKIAFDIIEERNQNLKEFKNALKREIH